MKGYFLPLLILGSCASVVPVPTMTFRVAATDPRNPFGLAKTPTAGDPRIFGGYSAGCLAGAIRLPLSGPGYEVMRASRNRIYGHPALIALLKRSGQELGKSSPLLIGDMAQPLGGPMPTGHTSHQTGLDVDIRFSNLSARATLTPEMREKMEGESLLQSDSVHLNPEKWKKVFVDQLLWFATQPEVERVFVNVAIKQELCHELPGDARLLKLRPWYGHDDHFHVRLKCPSEQTACQGQKAPDGVECEAEKLKYWYSSEALDNLRNPKNPSRIVDLPAECQTLVRSGSS